jgi:tetratricopeptide (TPR) repeat protein
LVLDLPEHQAKDDEVRITAALRWLGEHSGWLLILDNVDTDEAATAVEGLLGRLRSGHVLVTSRRTNWSAGVERLPLDVLSEDDAVAFLLERTDGGRATTARDAADARELVRELGGLALAIEQAGAFIAAKHESLGGYLRRWREREAKVRAWHDETLMHYPRALAVTWDTSVAQLDAGALALLRLLCWLAPEPIPRALLETDEAKQALAQAAGALVEAGERAAGGAVSADAEDALAGLAGLSLVTWESGQAVRMHRLVGEITRERAPAAERQAWLTAVLGIVNAYLPDDPQPWDVRAWPLWEPVLAHVAAVVTTADKAGIAHRTSRLMNDWGGLLWAKGVWAEAEALWRRALAIDEASYGPDHPAVAVRLNNLAQLLQAMNRLSEAERLMRRGLAIDEASYGPDHPNAATRLNNLATLLQATNRLREAEPLMRRALAIDEASYGPDHPDVARDLSNLAQLFQATNRLGDAEPLMRRALRIDAARHGADHPRVATALNNLALLLRATDRPSEAESLMRRAVAIDEESYGPEHHDVGRDLNNLAALLQDANRLAEAEPLMRRVLGIWEKSHGPDHPKVGTVLNNLAQLLQAMSRLSEAEPLMRRALAIDEDSYGPEHPDVARDLNNLATLLQDADRLSEAEPLMRRVVEIFLAFTQATGHEHPHLRAAFRNFIDLLQQMGHSEAEAEAQLSALKARFGVALEAS